MHAIPKKAIYYNNLVPGPPTDPSLVVHNSPQNLKLLIESKDPPLWIDIFLHLSRKQCQKCKTGADRGFPGILTFFPWISFCGNPDNRSVIAWLW